MSKLKSLSLLPVYEDNPFNEALITKLNTTGKTKYSQFIAMSNKEIVDKATGEVVEGGNQILMGKRKVVDEDEFVKVYMNELRKYLDASKGDMELFFYLVSKLEFNQNYVWFDIDDCLKSTNLSSGTIYRSLANLCNAGIIARSDKYYKYFINPIVMFKGDRVVIVEEYVRRDRSGGKKKLPSGE